MLKRLLTALLAASLLAACSSTTPPTLPTLGSGSPRPTGPIATTATPDPGSTSDPAASPTSPSSASPPPSTPSPPSGDAFDRALAARLQTVLDKLRERVKSPGLSAAVVLDDGRAWAGTSGDRQLSPAEPVDPDTVFAIGSITKTFVAATVMELVDEGKLSLTDHLDRWVPGIKNAKRITVAELLGHTSGVYNYFENPAYDGQVFKNAKKRWTFDEILALVRAPYCAPGGCYHYSNTNFVLLGRIVELVTGHSLASEIEQRFAAPLQLDQTALQPDEATPADHAHGYRGNIDWTRKSSVIPTMSAATVAWAAGAMVSNASDLAHWASWLYTGALVPQPALGQMLQFQPCHDNYGLGTRKYVINGRVAYGHLGSLRGFTGAMWYFPEEGATLVLLSNLGGGWNLDAAVRKLQSVLMTGIGAPAPALDPGTNTRNHDGVTLRC